LLRPRCLAFRAAPGSLLSDRSVPDGSRSAPLTNCSALDAWLSMPVCGLLRTLTLCALALAHGLLRAQLLSSAPDPDCSVFDTWRFVRCADISLPLTLRPVLLTDASVLNTWSLVSNPYVSDTYRSAPDLGLLPVRHLALCAPHGFLHASHLVPCAAPGLLPMHHLVLRAWTSWQAC